MRIHPDGDSPPEAIVAGLYQKGSATWSYFIREPVLSPDMTRLALISDGPDPTKSDVILQFFDLATGQLTSAGAAQNRPLGHQDPAWSPDGARVLYVRNGREGSRGAPFLMRYAVPTGKSSALAGPGYIAPGWSPDGRWIVATQTDGLGTDVVILDASTGAELLRVTNDGQSFSGTWSPAGGAIAYLRIDGGVVDLQMVTLAGPGPDWTLGRTLPLTDAAGLDAASRPYWFIPPDQLPEPTPTPTPTPTPGLSASPASSAP
jgi:dipeptidyl aminopeptidase/acylaminoacyl peptidase